MVKKCFIPLVILGLLASDVFSASHSALVSLKGMQVWTTSSDDPNWNSGDKVSVRLTNNYPWPNCSYNSVWFNNTGGQGATLLALLTSAAAQGKPVVISVRDDTKVGGVVCELTHIETLP